MFLFSCEQRGFLEYMFVGIIIPVGECFPYFLFLLFRFYHFFIIHSFSYHFFIFHFLGLDLSDIIQYCLLYCVSNSHNHISAIRGQNSLVPIRLKSYFICNSNNDNDKKCKKSSNNDKKQW